MSFARSDVSREPAHTAQKFHNNQTAEGGLMRCSCSLDEDGHASSSSSLYAVPAGVNRRLYTTTSCVHRTLFPPLYLSESRCSRRAACRSLRTRFASSRSASMRASSDSSASCRSSSTGVVSMCTASAVARLLRARARRFCAPRFDSSSKGLSGRPIFLVGVVSGSGGRAARKKSAVGARSRSKSADFARCFRDRSPDGLRSARLALRGRPRFLLGVAEARGAIARRAKSAKAMGARPRADWR